MSNDPEIPNTRWPDASAVPDASNGASPHLSDELLAAWMANELGNDEYHAIRRHLESCGYCRRALAEAKRIRAQVMAAGSMLPAATPSVAERVLARLPEDKTPPPNPLLVGEGGNAERSRRNRRSDIWRRLGALAAVLLLIASSALLFTRFSPRFQPGKAAATATPINLANLPGVWKSVIPAGSTIWDIAVVSPSDIWAAGNVASAGEVKTVLVHFDGQRWHLSPDVFTNAGLYSISMVSTTEGWASGNTSDGGPLMLHYTGGHWRLAQNEINTSLPGLQKMMITKVRMKSPTAGWAIGAPGRQSTQIFRYLKIGNIYSWEPANGVGATMFAMSAVSDDEVWMVGDDGNNTVIARDIAMFDNPSSGLGPARWDVHTWNVGAGNLTSINMLSSTDGWAAGADNSGHGVLFHWDGQRWTQVDVRPGGQQLGPIQGIVMTGANTGWVFGANADRTRAYLYSMANGHWYAYHLEASEVLTGVAITPSVLLATTAPLTFGGHDPIPAVFNMKDGAPVVTP